MLAAVVVVQDLQQEPVLVVLEVVEVLVLLDLLV
jgi:hypothetical protein